MCVVVVCVGMGGGEGGREGEYGLLSGEGGIFTCASCYNVITKGSGFPRNVEYGLPHTTPLLLSSLSSTHCRPGVQLQQADGDGRELAGRGVRLRQHHALRPQHLRAQQLPGHHPAASQARHGGQTGDWSAGQAQPRRYTTGPQAV